MKVQDSQTMISGYAYDDNYKIRLSDDVKANEEMKDEWMNEEMESGRIYECKSLEIQCPTNDHDTKEDESKQHVAIGFQWSEDSSREKCKISGSSDQWWSDMGQLRST